MFLKSKVNRGYKWGSLLKVEISMMSTDDKENTKLSVQVQSSLTMCSLTMGICSKKCVVRLVLHCANILECTYINLEGIAYYTPRHMVYSLLLLGYKPVQHVNLYML